MKERTLTLVSFAAALAVLTLGLAALGAAGFKLTASPALGLVFFAFAGSVALSLRLARARGQLDAAASAELGAARALIDRGDYAAAMNVASSAAARAMSADTRNAALTALALASLGNGYPQRAKAAIGRIDPPTAVDPCCLAAVQSSEGQYDEAIQSLERARGAGSLSCDGAKLLVDLYVRQNQMGSAVTAALQTREILGTDNCRIVVRAACEAGAYDAASTLASALFGSTHAPEDAAALTRARLRMTSAGSLTPLG